jgi:hypothetical protein
MAACGASSSTRESTSSHGLHGLSGLPPGISSFRAAFVGGRVVPLPTTNCGYPHNKAWVPPRQGVGYPTIKCGSPNNKVWGYPHKEPWVPHNLLSPSPQRSVGPPTTGCPPPHNGVWVPPQFERFRSPKKIRPSPKTSRKAGLKSQQPLKVAVIRTSRERRSCPGGASPCSRSRRCR